jgi:surface-anchored protein
MRFGRALAVLLTCGAFAARALAGPGHYTLGHADIRPYYENAQLKLRYELSGGAIVDGQEVDPVNYNPVSFSPTGLIVTIADVPLMSPDNRFDFTGASVGENLWLMPEGNLEAEALGLPWLGFSTEEFAHDGSWVGDRLFINLIGKVGPGHVSMFFSPEDELAAPQVHFTTFDGIDGNDAYRQYGSADPGLSVGAHTHVNWAFTQPGLYDLTFRFSGQHATDGYKEAIGTFTFQVGAVPEPASLAMAIIGATAALRRRSITRRTGP